MSEARTSSFAAIRAYGILHAFPPLSELAPHVRHLVAEADRSRDLY
jgi:hypothetical protein